MESVRIGTWKLAYRGLMPQEHLDALEVTEQSVAARAARVDQGWSTFVAEVGGVTVGMATCGPCRDEDLDALELGALYVLPEHWGTGAGTALLAACGPVQTLWVLDGNARAVAFYDRHGFIPDGADKRHPSLGVREIRMVRNLG